MFCFLFFTASDCKKYAIKAFKYAAVDYILKPVDIDELKTAIEKIIGNKNEEIQNSEHSTKLSLNTNEEIKLVDISDIIRLESDGNYTKFYFKDKKECYKILTRFTKKSSRVGFYFMNNDNDLYINNSNKLQIQYNTKTTAF